MHTYNQSRTVIIVINLLYDIGESEVEFISYLFCHGKWPENA